MLIIFDGPDCVWKTTLATGMLTRVAARYPDDEVELVHRGPPTSHPLDEYVTPLLSYRPRSGRHIICDRWHWGEHPLTYPALTDRPTLMDEAVWRYTEAFLASRGAVVVACDATDEAIRACVDGRGDPTYTADQVVRVAHGFREVARRSTLRVVHPTGVTEDEVIETVLRFAYDEEMRTYPLDRFTTYVGPPSPEFLLLGDVRATGTTDLRPAFMPYQATSGHYLLSHLPPEMTPGSVGLANACDVDSWRLLWHHLGFPKIVALGNNSFRRTDRRHGAVPHPQYWRRFLHRHGREYGEILARAALKEEDLRDWRPDDAWMRARKTT